MSARCAHKNHILTWLLVSVMTLFVPLGLCKIYLSDIILCELYISIKCKTLPMMARLNMRVRTSLLARSRYESNFSHVCLSQLYVTTSTMSRDKAEVSLLGS